jgi:hypothetical protein
MNICIQEAYPQLLTKGVGEVESYRAFTDTAFSGGNH